LLKPRGTLDCFHHIHVRVVWLSARSTPLFLSVFVLVEEYFYRTPLLVVQNLVNFFKKDDQKKKRKWHENSILVGNLILVQGSLNSGGKFENWRHILRKLRMLRLVGWLQFGADLGL